MPRFCTIFCCPRLSAAYFTAKPMVLVLGQYSTGTIGMDMMYLVMESFPKMTSHIVDGILRVQG